uniref:Uncharacterized protein n=1 Tax=Glycine max TaxID=3847 RepID=C6TDP4_SOYBN|nr:unknown [Glycine max]
MNLPQKFNSVQFYLFNPGHSIGFEINQQNLHRKKMMEYYTLVIAFHV